MHDILNLLNRLAFLLSPIFYLLVFMSISAALIGGMILIVRQAADRKISPLWKYLLWGLVMVALMVPFRPHSDFSLMGFYEPVKGTSFREEYDQSRYEEKLTLQEEYTSADSLSILTKDTEGLFLKSLVFDVALPLCWFFGMVGLAGFFLISRIHLYRKVKSHAIPCTDYDELFFQCQKELRIKAPVRLVVQDYLSTPAILGFVHPKVLLPSFPEQELSEESLRYILLHELSHYKRRDTLVNLLLLILQAVYWFNPCIWVIFRRIREDMEVENDSFVLEKIGSDHSKAYARSLVEVLGYSSHISMMPRIICMVDKTKNVERRIRMIQLRDSFKKHKLAISALCLALILAVSVLFLTQRNLSEKQAANAFMDSISSKDGVISFILPQNYSHPENWNIHISGRMNGGGGMSVHLFEEENISHSWEKGKTYTIDTKDKGYTELYLDLYLLEEERSANLLSYLYSNKGEADQALLTAFNHRTEHASDKENVAVLASHFIEDMGENFSYGIGNKGKDKLVITFTDGNDFNLDSLRRTALKLFASIGDLQQVTFAGKADFTMTAQEAKTYLGENIFQKTADKNSYFSVMAKILTLEEIPPEESKLMSISFPAYEDGDYTLGEIPLSTFDLVGNFPESWTLAPAEKSGLIPGNFHSVLSIMDGERLIGYTGFSTFEPYTEDIEPENYYKTVYPELRMSSFYYWDPYTAVARTENSETGIANLWYLEPEEIENYLGNLPDCPSVETLGLLCYNKELGVYAGIAFSPDLFTWKEVETLAKSVQIKPHNS